MMEQFLSQTFAPPAPAHPPIWLFDPATGTDLVAGNASLSLFGGGVVNSSQPIYGYDTIEWPTTASGGVITIPTNIQLGDNWTVEWQAYAAVAPVLNEYNYELLGYTTSATDFIYTVWGDSGFSYQMRMAFGPFTDQAKVWRGGPARNEIAGIVRTHAFVCSNRVVSYYYNGVRQATLINWNATIDASKQVTTPTFPMGTPFAPLRQFLIGSPGGANKGMVGRFGRIRISDFARYGSNYVPGALTL